MNLVSVIIPVYNCSTFLGRTLDSILAQTYSNLEVLLVDDGSTDDSITIARKYNCSFLRILKQKNSGAGIARNTGLFASKGDFFQFLDAGDVISPNKIATQVEALHQQKGKVAVCNYKQFSNQAELNTEIYPDQSHFIYSTDDIQSFLINLWGGNGKMNFIQTNCWLIPREVQERAGIWRSYRCPDDDGEFFARVLLASDGIVYTPGVYNYYHITPGGLNQLSRSKNVKYLMNTLLSIDLKYNYLRKFDNHPLLNRAIAAQYYRFAIDMYPESIVLSAIAWRRFINLKEHPPEVILGGRLIQFIYHLFGWRVARFIRFYLRTS